MFCLPELMHTTYIIQRLTCVAVQQAPDRMVDPFYAGRQLTQNLVIAAPGIISLRQGKQTLNLFHTPGGVPYRNGERFGFMGDGLFQFFLHILTIGLRNTGLSGTDKPHFITQSIQRLHHPPHDRVPFADHVLQLAPIEGQEIEHSHVQIRHVENALPSSRDLGNRGYIGEFGAQFQGTGHAHNVPVHQVWNTGVRRAAGKV